MRPILLILTALLGPPPAHTAQDGQLEQATFAAGCFWCLELPFEQLDGVHSVISGYAGGVKEEPSYREVASGETGHLEVVQITYDPEVISYGRLLQVYWRSFDPTDEGGSFVDRGHQYTSAIFVHNEAHYKLATASKKALGESGVFEDPIVTPIRRAEKFWPAEDHHQNFYKTNPDHYKRYRSGSGRNQFIQRVWGPDPYELAKYRRPPDAELRAQLTNMQYEVTQEDGTEPPFNNEFWDNTMPGIYVDIVSGEALFSSTDKYNSRTGWPSFTRPLVPKNIIEDTDYKLIYPRTEVRSKHGDSHLGHVFRDGPDPTGLRYCINSAALRFIPSEDLEAEGYPEFANKFE